VRRSGWLHKKDVSTGAGSPPPARQAGWKPVYFVLSDTTLVYFESNKTMYEQPLGGVLLTARATIEAVEEPGAWAAWRRDGYRYSCWWC
jgi:hypothetical protein